MRRQIGALAFAAAVLAFAPGLAGNTARAHEITDGQVSASHCILTDAGVATVTPGSEVVIRQGWLTQLRGDQKTFLGAQTTIVSVNDSQMWDVSTEWGQPDGAGAGWASAVEIPTGVTLASGEQMRFTFALLLKRDVIADGGFGIPPNTYRAGLVFGGTCTVSGRVASSDCVGAALVNPASRSRSRRSEVRSPVATKTVSSPAIEPTISGQRVRSSAAATAWALPGSVLMTSSRSADAELHRARRRGGGGAGPRRRPPRRGGAAGARRRRGPRGCPCRARARRRRG